MAEPANKEATYSDLFDIPENMTGEIINGELIAAPRPSRRHVYASTSLGGKLTPPYQFGEANGPGGWIIIIEPEVGLGRNILVPDLAGWKRERFPVAEDHNWISTPPDWVCEVLSPGTAKIDKTGKMSIYAQHTVPYLWFIDPLAKTLDAFRLENGKWVVVGLFVGSDTIRIAPFEEAEIDLNALWLD
jgi:Uma2 family endonuclease